MTCKELIFLGISFCLLVSCTKESTTTVPDNDSPDYSEIPTIKVQNYVNRMFIDLISREPTDAEMDSFVLELRKADLAPDKRLELVKVLQEGTFYVPGDSSYNAAYHQTLYNLAKGRCIEGASDGEIETALGPIYFGIYQDSLLGNWEGVAKGKERALKFERVLSSRSEMMSGAINYTDLLGRMIDNPIYDAINMNSFNFVNASFDNLLWRYPTQAEFEEGYKMVEFNQPALIFGNSGQTKADYVRILSESQEAYEGVIIWCYQLLVARRPATAETFALLPDFLQHRQVQRIQQQIIITDEYANFK